MVVVDQEVQVAELVLLIQALLELEQVDLVILLLLVLHKEIMVEPFQVLVLEVVEEVEELVQVVVLVRVALQLVLVVQVYLHPFLVLL